MLSVSELTDLKALAAWGGRTSGELDIPCDINSIATGADKAAAAPTRLLFTWFLKHMRSHRQAIGTLARVLQPSREAREKGIFPGNFGTTLDGFGTCIGDGKRRPLSAGCMRPCSTLPPAWAPNSRSARPATAAGILPRRTGKPRGNISNNNSSNSNNNSSNSNNNNNSNSNSNNNNNSSNSNNNNNNNSNSSSNSNSNSSTSAHIVIEQTLEKTPAVALAAGDLTQATGVGGPAAAAATTATATATTTAAAITTAAAAPAPAPSAQAAEQETKENTGKEETNEAKANKEEEQQGEDKEKEGVDAGDGGGAYIDGDVDIYDDEVVQDGSIEYQLGPGWCTAFETAIARLQEQVDKLEVSRDATTQRINALALEAAGLNHLSSNSSTAGDNSVSGSKENSSSSSTTGSPLRSNAATAHRSSFGAIVPVGGEGTNVGGGRRGSVMVDPGAGRTYGGDPSIVNGAAALSGPRVPRFYLKSESELPLDAHALGNEKQGDSPYVPSVEASIRTQEKVLGSLFSSFSKLGDDVQRKEVRLANLETEVTCVPGTKLEAALSKRLEEVSKAVDAKLEGLQGEVNKVALSLEHATMDIRDIQNLELIANAKADAKQKREQEEVQTKRVAEIVEKRIESALWFQSLRSSAAASEDHISTIQEQLHGLKNEVVQLQAERLPPVPQLASSSCASMQNEDSTQHSVTIAELEDRLNTLQSLIQSDILPQLQGARRKTFPRVGPLGYNPAPLLMDSLPARPRPASARHSPSSVLGGYNAYFPPISASPRSQSPTTRNQRTAPNVLAVENSSNNNNNNNNNNNSNTGHARPTKQLRKYDTSDSDIGLACGRGSLGYMSMEDNDADQQQLQNNGNNNNSNNNCNSYVVGDGSRATLVNAGGTIVVTNPSGLVLTTPQEPRARKDRERSEGGRKGSVGKAPQQPSDTLSLAALERAMAAAAANGLQHDGRLSLPSGRSGKRGLPGTPRQGIPTPSGAGQVVVVSGGPGRPGSAGRHPPAGVQATSLKHRLCGVPLQAQQIPEISQISTTPSPAPSPQLPTSAPPAAGFADDVPDEGRSNPGGPDHQQQNQNPPQNPPYTRSNSGQTDASPKREEGIEKPSSLVVHLPVAGRDPS